MQGHSSSLSCGGSLCNSYGFTLAETLIVLVVLGVIATLTVPNLINKQKETTQRTKIKKAMAAYETAVNKMLLAHDRSFNNLNTAGCNTKTSYFKYIKRDTTNTCIFQAPDKLWWDVSDIERPLIAFEKNNLTVQTANAANNKDAFVMVGRYDDQGILRVNDLGFESIKGNSLKDSYGYESKAQLKKLYEFVKDIEPSPFTKCKAKNAETCIVNGVTYTRATLTGQSVTNKGKDNAGEAICVYDRNADPPTQTCDGTFESKTNEGDIVYFVDMGEVDYNDAMDTTDSICEDCLKQHITDRAYYLPFDYYQAAARNCEEQGARLATLAELKSLKSTGDISRGSYWSSTESDTDNAYVYNSSRRMVVQSKKDISSATFVCVGN